MHLIITDARSARTRSIHLSGVRLVLAGLLLSLGLMLVAALLYHWVFLKGARIKLRNHLRHTIAYAFNRRAAQAVFH